MLPVQTAAGAAGAGEHGDARVSLLQALLRPDPVHDAGRVHVHGCIHLPQVRHLQEGSEEGGRRRASHEPAGALAGRKNIFFGISYVF